MKYIDLNGEEGEVGVGGAVCGIGFSSVTLTADDLFERGFTDWFNEIVVPRMVLTTKGTIQ